MCKVSIVIPVFNNEKYLYQCMDSVLNQTLREIEIICVDDGSTDASSRILDEYAEKDSRIKVIHKENGGLVSARKTGVQLATSDYVGFVDSDDWIDPDMYEKLYTRAAENNADIVTSGYYQEGMYTSRLFDTIEQGFYSSEHELEYMRNNTIYNLSKLDLGIRGSLCCKLFLTEKLRKAQSFLSDKISMSEDKLCVLIYMLECNSIYILKEAFYHYRINPSSMVNKPNPNYLICVNEFYHNVIQLYSHSNFTDNMREQVELYVTELLVHGINKRLGFKHRNLLWIDPYWLDEIPEGSRVILYGAGELGEKYMRHLSSRRDLKLVSWIDFEYESLKDTNARIKSPDIVKSLDYDFIVITIKNKEKVQNIRSQLFHLQVPEEKILWFEQREIWWKFVKADGMTDEEFMR